jgi:ABC-type molybdate transport system substrate-binding protein
MSVRIRSLAAFRSRWSLIGKTARISAKGEAELAVQLSSEIHGVPGVQFVPMPPEFRASVTFLGAIATAAKQPVTAKAFLEFLTAPGAAAAIRSKGFEPG